MTRRFPPHSARAVDGSEPLSGGMVSLQGIEARQEQCRENLRKMD